MAEMAEFCGCDGVMARIRFVLDEYLTVAPVRAAVAAGIRIANAFLTDSERIKRRKTAVQTHITDSNALIEDRRAARLRFGLFALACISLGPAGGIAP
jgi:hypothetical protein